MLPYRLALSIAAPALLAALLWRVLRGRETWGDLGQRLGGGRGAGGGEGRPGAIWVHGASNGELTSARRLIEALAAEAPLVVTANTVTGRALVDGWALPGVTARLAPLDLRWALARFRRRWQPSVLVSLENELWPNRFATSRVPVVCVGARMSARSARRWAMAPGLARQLLGRVTLLVPQDEASGGRFAALGLPGGALGAPLQMKSAVDQAEPDAAELARLRAIFDRPDTVLAASTHEGEEEIVLDGLRRARAARPHLRLIVAPRHPARGAAVAALARERGFRVARRALDEAPGETDVYVADTLGEMPLWYSLAGVTFVGGSLVARGGHTPYEPAALHSAILHGPHTANFEPAYAALQQAAGARQVRDAEDLAQALVALDDPAEQAALARRADKALAGLSQGEERRIEDLAATILRLAGAGT